MCAFVEHDGPRILDCHVRQNEVAVAALLEKSRELDRLALEQRSKLTQLFAIAERHDLHRDGKIYVALVIKAPKIERICSKRTATSRPFFCPPPLTTEKCGEPSPTFAVAGIFRLFSDDFRV